MDDTGSTHAPTGDEVLLDGRYELLERIGVGGMAEVWRARDVRLQRDVAVKLLSGQAADPSRRKRIEREARALAATTHPNIVEVYDYGEAEGTAGDVRPYLVMELVDGPDLHRYLQERGALPVEEARGIMLGVLSAVHRAHDSGVVHGDLKPANVYIGSHGPKVGDFGVARILDEETGLTTAAATPTFAAPEVLKGERPDPRSDVYSAACLAFELLTARPPYDGANGWEIAAKHIDSPVPKIRTLRSDVSPEFEAVIHQGMAKEPKRRHADAAAFEDALRNVPSGDGQGTVPLAAAGAAGAAASAAPVGAKTETLGPRPDLARAAVLGPLGVVGDKASGAARWTADRIGRTRNRRAILVILVAVLMLFAVCTLREPGVASTKVPKLEGQTYQDAAAKLKKADLRLDDVSFRPVAEGESGRVIRTIPAVGTEVPEGTEVHLIASVVQTPSPQPVVQPSEDAATKAEKQAARRARRAAKGGDD